ncbi:hypothetical protein MtrunA17_Chr4g0064561 [Medicago truncatula]|uniref:Uncharacterized protein n=1 Tax=Medicago truncatula TaxID=3880 RepID=A0A396II68_MEDTR|nr:hypothetical protein MtrunA17_Chr4g0064561 [Medicago truncatula]
MVAASASETQASLTLTNISPLKLLFSLCLSPSPTSNCTANLATQLANSLSNLCNSTNFSTTPSFNIPSTASFLPKYPISRTHSIASKLNFILSEFNNAMIFVISPFDSISSTIGDLINLIKEHRTSIERTEPISIKASTVGFIKTSPTNTSLLKRINAEIAKPACSRIR